MYRRRADEWNGVHIENAAFVQNLAPSGTADALLVCHTCTFAVYCRTGSRAGAAIERLRMEFGFQGELFNALGVTQWQKAGYPLVTSDPVDAPCNNDYVCKSCSKDPDDDKDPEDDKEPEDDKDLEDGTSSGKGRVVSQTFLTLSVAIMVFFCAWG